jgi:type II secretory pathway pseudopilin PulG
MAKKITRHSNSGFSLIESLLSLTLFLFILVTSLEFFVSTRNHFFDLKNEQEVNQAAYATLDKIRLDLCECGRGLIVPQSKGLFYAIQVIDATLIIQSKDMDILPENDLVTGQTFIPVVSTKGIKKGQKLCFSDPEKGEVKTIISVDKHGLTLSSSLNSSYRKDEATFILIRTISFFLDSGRGILRRKVNTSPAQPLLEDVSAFNVFYEATSNIVSLSLILKIKEEKKYEASIFPKNMALVSTQ